MLSFAISIPLSLLAMAYSIKFDNRIRPRVIDGVNACDDDYVFVVALCTKNRVEVHDERPIIRIRACTGSLVTEEWVLTAAHCIDPRIVRIRYGDFTIPPNSSMATYSNILKTVVHPAYRTFDLGKKFGYVFDKLANDIGLVQVENVPLREYGSISGVDYTAVIGYPVRYAGLGRTILSYEGLDKGKAIEADESRKLQLGEAIITRCPKLNYVTQDIGPFLCLAPKCDQKTQKAFRGDSGGPLFHAGKIIAISAGSFGEKEARFTPVSPYLDWILETISPKY